MRKNTKNALALIGAALLSLGLMTGCSGTASSNPAEASKTEAVTTVDTEAVKDISEENTEKETGGNSGEADADLSGSITLAGSTSMEKLVNALSESFMEKYPNVTMQGEFTGSSAGVEAVLGGQADIGNASRAITEEEKNKGVVENIVAIDGIAVVTNPSNKVLNLTRDQLISIYDGTVTNWSELGGESQPIVVIGREAGSGTRSAFEEILELKDACKYSNELDSTGAVVAKAASTPGSIGYVSLDVLDDTVKAFTLEGVEANPDNIKSGTYFLSRPFVMATNGQISQQSDLVKAVFEYIFSEEGTELVKAVGLIPVE